MSRCSLLLVVLLLMRIQVSRSMILGILRSIFGRIRYVVDAPLSDRLLMFFSGAASMVQLLLLISNGKMSCFRVVPISMKATRSLMLIRLAF